MNTLNINKTLPILANIIKNGDKEGKYFPTIINSDNSVKKYNLDLKKVYVDLRTDIEKEYMNMRIPLAALSSCVSIGSIIGTVASGVTIAEMGFLLTTSEIVAGAVVGPIGLGIACGYLLYKLNESGNRDNAKKVIQKSITHNRKVLIKRLTDLMIESYNKEKESCDISLVLDIAVISHVLQELCGSELTNKIFLETGRGVDKHIEDIRIKQKEAAVKRTKEYFKRRKAA